MGEEQNLKKDEDLKDEAALVQEARLKLKAENDALEAEKLRSEKLRAAALIGGRTAIATPVQEETFQEKWKRTAKERYKGTGYDPT